MLKKQWKSSSSDEHKNEESRRELLNFVTLRAATLLYGVS